MSMTVLQSPYPQGEVQNWTNFGEQSLGTPADWEKNSEDASFTIAIDSNAGGYGGKALRWKKTSTLSRAYAAYYLPPGTLGTTFTEVDILGLFEIVAATQFGLLVKSSNAGALYVRVFGANLILSLQNSPTLTGTTIHSVAHGMGTLSVGHQFYLRAHYTMRTDGDGGVDALGKVWRVGNSEPGSWLVSGSRTFVQMNSSLPGEIGTGVQTGTAQPEYLLDYLAWAFGGESASMPS